MVKYQKYLSSKTSINAKRLPALHKAIIDGKFDKIIGSFDRVYDYGCGRFYEMISNAYADIGIKYFGYDLTYQRKRWFDVYSTAYRPNITTLSNVLNVIAEDEIIEEIMKHCVRNTNDFVIVSIYEGDKTGIGKVTKDGESYQRNQKTKDYMEMIESMGFDCFMKYGYIFVEGKANELYFR